MGILNSIHFDVRDAEVLLWYSAQIGGQKGILLLPHGSIYTLKLPHGVLSYFDELPFLFSGCCLLPFFLPQLGY